jgi:aerobic carbon-monoxide dehydrogenase medium subunit
MRLPGFTYHRPETIDEACSLAVSLGDRTHFLAGGTELLTELKRGRVDAANVISLKGIEALSGIHVDDDALHIGALTRLEDVARSSDVRETFPVLAEAVSAIGCLQIREQGTIGGNFCGAVPCADSPPACIVAGATVRIIGTGGDRTSAAEDLFLGPRETTLAAGEILAEIRLPIPAQGSGAAYERFALRKGMAVAVASVAAGLRMDGDTVAQARIALGAVAPVPLLALDAAAALVGLPVTEEVIAEIGALAAKEAKPICDVRGSDEYRRGIVAVLTRRALIRAANRARGGQA